MRCFDTLAMLVAQHDIEEMFRLCHVAVRYDKALDCSAIQHDGIYDFFVVADCHSEPVRESGQCRRI